MSKRKPTWATIGSICEGSLNWTDKQIERLSDELRQLLRRCRVGREDRKRANSLLHAVDRRSKRLYRGIYLDELIAALDGFAPPHAWFGERAGEWGFWPVVDDDDVPRLNCTAIDVGGYTTRWWGGDAVYLVNDHGNVTCGCFDKRGRFTAYWSVV